MRRFGWAIGSLVVAGLLIAPLPSVVRSLRMTRGGMATFTALLASSNAQDLDAVRALCSRRYLASHPIRRSLEGGVVGLPRNIHKNFQVWREGGEVWLCPTNRVGPVYRLVLEGGSWKFDGLVGLLRPGGRVEPMGEDAGETGNFPEDFLGNIRPCDIPLSGVQGPSLITSENLRTSAQGRVESSPQAEQGRPTRPSSWALPGDIGNS